VSKPKRKRSNFVRLLVICVSAYMIATLVSLWKNLDDKQKELNALNEELSTRANEVSELKDLLENGSKEQIVEKAARQRLGFVYSNEEVYIDISGN